MSKNRFEFKSWDEYNKYLSSESKPKEAVKKVTPTKKKETK